MAIDSRKTGHFRLEGSRMKPLITACYIHNGEPPQSDPTLAVCLDLGRVGITPDPERLSTTTAKAVASI